MPEHITHIVGTRAGDYLPALRATVERLERIEALAENAHWATDRRWRIAALAASAIEELRVCVTEIEQANR